MTKPDPEKNKAIGLLVMAMASHFYDKDVSPEQTALKTLDFINDLAEFTITEIQSAFTNYRQDAKRKRFATPGEIRELCYQERKDRRDASRPPTRLPSRPSMWWTRCKLRWEPGWHESEVPFGNKIRDTPDSPWRYPVG